MSSAVTAVAGVLMIVAGIALARWTGNRMPADHELRNAGAAPIPRLMGQSLLILVALFLCATGIIAVTWNFFA